jgi:hypothetical protein
VKKVRGKKSILHVEEIDIIGSGVRQYLPHKISSVILTLVILALVLFFGWNYLQPLFNTQKQNHSVTQPATGDKVKVSTMGVQPHGVGKPVPSDPGSKVIEAPLETSRIPAPLPTPLGRSNTEIRVREIVEVKAGANLHSLAYQYYKEANETAIDHILKLNPEITNPNLIRVNQKIKIPEITDSLLIVQYSKNLYKVHLKTFSGITSARQYKRGVTLRGKEIEIVPWKISPGETWYRVMAGPFDNRTEGSKVIEEMNLK